MMLFNKLVTELSSEKNKMQDGDAALKASIEQLIDYYNTKWHEAIQKKKFDISKGKEGENSLNFHNALISAVLKETVKYSNNPGITAILTLINQANENHHKSWVALCRSLKEKLETQAEQAATKSMISTRSKMSTMSTQSKLMRAGVASTNALTSADTAVAKATMGDVRWHFFNKLCETRSGLISKKVSGTILQPLQLFILAMALKPATSIHGLSDLFCNATNDTNFSETYTALRKELAPIINDEVKLPDNCQQTIDDKTFQLLKKLCESRLTPEWVNKNLQNLDKFVEPSISRNSLSRK